MGKQIRLFDVPNMPLANKGKKRAQKTKVESTAERMGRQQREISVSEFFTKNRHLLGFDNPRKALLTAVKEAVDNSLDACEEAGILPDIHVQIEQIGEDRFRLTVEDNGPGIVIGQIPRIFAKLLYGSKFHRLRMSRGQQGIGISAAGMYAQLTTGKPVKILSRTSPQEPAHYCELFIDTVKNEPKIVSQSFRDWNRETGTRVEMELEGRFMRGRQSVDEYLEQTALVNPHASFTYIPPDGEAVIYPRSINQLPPQPLEIKPHPHGVELGILMQMMQQTSCKQLKAFLKTDFCRVGETVARRICEAAGLSEKARPSRLSRGAAENLLNAIRQTRIMGPPTDCIIPVGKEALETSLRQQINADLYAAATRPPSVYRGNPFLVEAALAYGGDLPADEPARLLRFANRVPLLYQQGGCAITKACLSVNWRSYGVQQPSGALPIAPMMIMVHIASVWVPFTSESKESIAHYPEIIQEIRLAIQECGRALMRFLRRRKKEQEAERKRLYLERYVPHIAGALSEILGLDEAERNSTEQSLQELLAHSRS